MIDNPSQDKKADAKTAVDDLVNKHSRDFCEDAKRCKAFLNDSCPSSRPQISALVSAVEHGIVSQILKESGPDHEVLDSTQIHKFGKKLNEDFAVDINMAQWATETWAEALGVYQPTTGSGTTGSGTTGSGTTGSGTAGSGTTNIFEKFRLWIFGALALAFALLFIELLKSLIPTSRITGPPTPTVTVPQPLYL